MMMQQRIEELREESGAVTYSDPLTAFLYDLMRDHLPAGVVEKMIRENVDNEQECIFTNGWLAKYAHNLAERINNSKLIHLQKELENVFEGEEKVRDEKAKEANKKQAFQVYGIDSPSKTIEDDILSQLQDKIAEAKDSDETEDAMDDFNTVERAKKIVEKLKSDGHIPAEDAARLQEELDEVEIEVEEVDSIPEDAVKLQEISDDRDEIEEVDNVIEDAEFVEEERKDKKRFFVVKNEAPRNEVKETEVETDDKDKMTSEEAKKIVDDTMKLEYDTTSYFQGKDKQICEELFRKPIPEKYTKEEVKEIMGETLKMVKGMGEEAVRNLRNGEPVLEKATDEETEKWKNMNDELQKLSEEEE